MKQKGIPPSPPAGRRARAAKVEANLQLELETKERWVGREVEVRCGGVGAWVGVDWTIRVRVRARGFAPPPVEDGEARKGFCRRRRVVCLCLPFPLLSSLVSPDLVVFCSYVRMAACMPYS
jgi:hypothetical protein